MIYFLLIIHFIVTYVISPLSVYAIACMITNPRRQELLPTFSASIVFGPALLSLYLYYELMAFTGLSTHFYFILTIILLLIPLTIFLFKPYLLHNLWIEIKSKISTFTILDYILIAFLVLILLSLFALSAALPLYGHDISEHSTYAALIAEIKDFSIYPLRGYKGYFTHSKHPPSVVGLWVWQYLSYFSSTYDQTFLGRLISPSVTLLTCISLIGFVKKRQQTLSIIACIILICTPLMYTNIATSHIDIHRCATYSGSAMWLLLFMRTNLKSNAIMTGIAIGLASRAHFSSLVVGPFLAISFGIVSVLREGFRWNILAMILKTWLIMAIPAIVICGFDYIRVFLLYGENLISTEEAFSVFSAAGIDYNEYIKITRNLHGLENRIVNGLLKGFTNINFLGFTYWLAVIGAVILYFKRRFNDFLTIIGLQAMLFMLMLVIATVFDITLLIKNARYYLAFQPFIAFMASAALEPLYEKRN